MLGVFEVLRVDDVNLQLGVTADAHLRHELALSLHRLLQLELDFFLLTVVIDDVLHDLFAPLLQLVLRLDILHNELLTALTDKRKLHCQQSRGVKPSSTYIEIVPLSSRSIWSKISSTIL